MARAVSWKTRLYAETRVFVAEAEGLARTKAVFVLYLDLFRDPSPATFTETGDGKTD